MRDINLLVLLELSGSADSAAPVVDSTPVQTPVPMNVAPSVPKHIHKDIESTNQQLLKVHEKMQSAREKFKEYPITSIKKMKDAHEERKRLIHDHQMKLKKTY